MHCNTCVLLSAKVVVLQSDDQLHKDQVMIAFLVTLALATLLHWIQSAGYLLPSSANPAAAAAAAAVIG
jgi:hypothetical protein